MGVHPSIDHERFPKQSRHVGKRVEVCFHYDPTHALVGELVRDDAEPPFVGVIRLDDGRHVLSTECHYTLPRGAP